MFNEEKLKKQKSIYSFKTLLHISQVNFNENWDEDEAEAGLFKRMEVKQVPNMLDKETQIYNNDPHLFVFDDEVTFYLSSFCWVVLKRNVEFGNK